MSNARFFQQCGGCGDTVSVFVTDIPRAIVENKKLVNRVVGAFHCQCCGDEIVIADVHVADTSVAVH